MSVKDVTKQSEYDELTKSGIAIVDFGASWCGPCKRIEPIFKDLAKSNPEMKFIHVDIDEASESLPNVLNDISSVPTFYFYNDGKKVDSFTGGNSNRLKQLVDKLKDTASNSNTSNSKVENITHEANKVIVIENSTDYKAHIAEGKTVINFSAISWCMPCKVIEPIFEGLANDFSHVKFLKVDIEKCEQLEEVVKEINSVPTFFFMVNGILTDMLSGANPSLLKKKIENLNTTSETEAKPMNKYKDSLTDESSDIKETNNIEEDRLSSKDLSSLTESD